jgi:hypothetical protein
MVSKNHANEGFGDDGDPRHQGKYDQRNHARGAGEAGPEGGVIILSSRERWKGDFVDHAAQRRERRLNDALAHGVEAETRRADEPADDDLVKLVPDEEEQGR